MAVPTWPSSLPLPIGQIGSLGSEQLYAPPQETEFDDGPSRVRRRRLYDETPRTITMTLTRAEFALFRAFVRDTLSCGARRFVAQIRQPNGRLGQRTCRIRGAVAEQDQGSHSTVSFTLMVQDW